MFLVIFGCSTLLNTYLKIKNNILLAYQTIYFYNFVFYCNKY